MEIGCYHWNKALLRIERERERREREREILNNLLLFWFFRIKEFVLSDKIVQAKRWITHPNYHFY